MYIKLNQRFQITCPKINTELLDRYSTSVLTSIQWCQISWCYRIPNIHQSMPMGSYVTTKATLPYFHSVKNMQINYSKRWSWN